MTYLTSAEVAERIERMAKNPSRTIPVVGTTESLRDVSRDLKSKLVAPGDGCFYLRSN